MLDTTPSTSAVAGETLAFGSLAHHFNGNEKNVHGSKSHTATTADPSSATRHSKVLGVGRVDSGIQRAAVNSASSSDRLVPFTTTLTSTSTETVVSSSGNIGFGFVGPVVVLLTSTGISTLPPTSTSVSVNSASRSDRLVPFTTTLTSLSAETLTATSGGSTFIATSSVPVLITSTGINTISPTSTSAVSASSASPAETRQVGILVVIVAGPLLVVGICIWLFVRRRRRRSRSRAEESQLEESIHPVTLLGPAHVPDIKKNDTDIIIAPKSEEPAQPTSNPFETPAEESATLSNSVTQNTERQMMLRTEIDNVRSQMAALQHSNQEMRATVARMMEHVQRLEADMAAEEGSEFSDAQPPTYVSS